MRKLWMVVILVASIALGGLAYRIGWFGRRTGVDEKPVAKRVAIVFPVTVDAFVQFRGEFEHVLKSAGVEVDWLSAEGDPNRFGPSVRSALLNHPTILVPVGTQVTNIAFGPQFRKDLPIVVASAISEPAKVDSLVQVGLEPPRSERVAIVSDSPKEDIYEVGAEVIASIIPQGGRIGLIYNTAEINSANTALSLGRAVEKRGISVLRGVISGGDDVERVTKDLLLKGADILVIPHDKYAVSKATVIVGLGHSAQPHPIPTFALDDGTVKKGGAALAVSVNYGLVGRTTAETCLRIIKGDDPARMPIQMQEKATVYVNQSSMDKCQLKLPSKFAAAAVIYSGVDGSK